MYLLKEHITITDNASLRIQAYDQPSIDIPWHFHPEYEVVLVNEGFGKLFVADGITDFGVGDLLMIGSNVPHYYQCAQTCEHISIKVIHFAPKVFSSHFLQLPELAHIKALLQKMTSGGLKLPDYHLENSFSLLLDYLCLAKGAEAIGRLILLLELMSNKQNQLIEIVGGINTTKVEDMPTLQRVTRYLMSNYQQPISLEKVAKIANMEKSYFCRYFKKHTRFTLKQYVNNLRINYACKLLVAKRELSIQQIAYEVGYNHSSQFIREFKKREQLCPSVYRKTMKEI